MCRYGIPGYRLPNDALAKDLEMIAGIGVTFHFGERFGRDFTEASLRADGFDAAYLAPGQWNGARLGIPGEDLPGVTDALALLRQVNTGTPVTLPGHVVVIGGGNTAIDAARTARRLGAAAVTLLYRRTRAQMPANDEEIDAALAEGVKLIELGAPQQVEKIDDRWRVSCAQMELSEPDEGGRPRPVPTGETFVVECDHVVTAIGQMAAVGADELPDVKVDRWGGIQAAREDAGTGNPFWFAGGDAVSGASSVADALQWGKYAAYGIDKTLAEDPDKVVIEHWRDREQLLGESRYAPLDVPTEARRHVPKREPQEAVGDFEEVDGVFTEAEAQAEARRCLACGYCAVCRNCLDNFGCPAFYQEDGRIQINPILCDGCGTCVQVCPNGAIVPVDEVVS